MVKDLKPLREWSIKAPWGKIALVSWGNPEGFPVLLVHGREDSASTFMPLLELLPEDYHYVAVDLPGCGKSDAFPIGVMLMRFTNVVAVDIVVRHLWWPQFIYIGHSLGTEIGSFFNAIYPNRIVKFVFLDPLPAWRKQQIRDIPEYFNTFYTSYYDNYVKQNSHDRVYSKQGALAAVARARGVTAAQAGTLLARSMTQIGDDQYRLSWDRRQKLPATLNLDNDYYLKLFTLNSPPTLVINATNTNSFMDNKEKTLNLMKEISKKAKNYKILTVEGDHDLHFKHPERIIQHILEFLNTDFAGKAKL